MPEMSQTRSGAKPGKTPKGGPPPSQTNNAVRLLELQRPRRQNKRRSLTGHCKVGTP
jgi:hypothetical protein